MVGRPKPDKLKRAQAKKAAAKGPKPKAAAVAAPKRGELGVLTTTIVAPVETPTDLLALGKFEAAIERVAAELALRDPDVEYAEQYAADLTITDQAGADEARDNALVLKDEAKSFDGDRKKLVEIPSRVVSRINALYKSREVRVERAFRKVKDKIAGYLDAQTVAQSEAWAEAEQQLEAGDHDAAQQTFAVANQHAIARKPSGFSARKKWTVKRIADPDLVPREWCKPDEQAIARLASQTPADQQPDVPGVEFELVNATTLR